MTAATAFGILLALIVLVAVRLNLRSVTIYEYERGLKYSRGRFRGVLEAGQYWYLTRLTTVRKVDVRVAVLAVSGQEVLSRDGVALKVSVAAKYRVVDPRRP